MLETFDYDGHLATLRVAYGDRCNAMDGALKRHLPDGARWQRPDGGLFIWIQPPGGIAAEVLRARMSVVPMAGSAALSRSVGADAR